MTEVLFTDEFDDWYQDLTENDQGAVTRTVTLLEERGTALGHPHSSALKGTEHPLRELRVQSGGKPLRVFYAFDPRRNAVLLLGGDKTGDGRFYEVMIPRAEKVWVEFLEETSDD